MAPEPVKSIVPPPVSLCNSVPIGRVLLRKPHSRMPLFSAGNGYSTTSSDAGILDTATLHAKSKRR